MPDPTRATLTAKDTNQSFPVHFNPGTATNVARGGAYDVSAHNLLRAGWREPYYDLTLRTHYLGFRCARPTP